MTAPRPLLRRSISNGMAIGCALLVGASQPAAVGGRPPTSVYTPAACSMQAPLGSPILRKIALNHGHAAQYSKSIVVDERIWRAFVATNVYGPGTGVGTVTVIATCMGRIVRTIRVLPISTIAVDPETGYVLVTYDPPMLQGQSAGPGTLTVLDARSGAVVHRMAIGYDSILAVDEQAGRDYIISGCPTAPKIVDERPCRGLVSTLDAASLRVLRTVRIGFQDHAAAVDAQTERLFVVNGGSATVSVLDARSGALLRTVWIAPPSPLAIAADTRAGRMFVPGLSGVSILDARTGLLVRTLSALSAGDLLWASVDERTGRAFFSADNSTVAVMDTTTDRVVRTVTVGVRPTDISPVAFDEARGLAFVATTNLGVPSGQPTGPGHLRVLDARSGKPLANVAVGNLPLTLAVDERAHRLLVADELNSTLTIIDTTRFGKTIP